MNTMRVIIRPVETKDAPEVLRSVRESLAEVSPWMPGLHSGLHLDDVEGWIADSAHNRAEGTGFNFAIVDPAADLFLGGCGLSSFNRGYNFTNLFYWVRTSQAGKGIATEAARQVADFAFKRLGMLRVEIVIAKPNEASIRVAEKIGAVREGLLRNRVTVRSQTYDAWMYSLIPSDFVESTRE